MVSGEFEIQLTNAEISELSEAIDNTFADAAGRDLVEENTLLVLVQQYLNYLNALELEVFAFRDQLLAQSNSTGEKMIALLASKDSKFKSQRQAIYNKFRQQEIFSRMKSMFALGYQLTQRIREYITNQEIQYNIGVYKKGSGKFISYSATEEHIIKNLYGDHYRFLTALYSAEQKELSYNAKYTASFKKSQLEGETEQLQQNLPSNGSTLWSKGYRVYQTAAQHRDIAVTLNFGHFLEAYYHFGGNKANHNPSGFNSLSFYQYMVALQNSTPFYQGGDFQDIQLTANTATITNISTIRKILTSIQGVLKDYKGSKRHKIKQMLTTKKLTKSQLAAKAAAVDVSPEMRDILKDLDTKT